MVHVQFNVSTTTCTNNIVAIRAPIGGEEVLVVVFCNLFGFFRFQLHGPNVIRTALIGNKYNGFSVGTVSRMYIICQSVCNFGCFPSRYRNSVQIPHHIKNDGFSIWTNIQREPCTFFGGKGNCSFGL